MENGKPLVEASMAQRRRRSLAILLVIALGTLCIYWGRRQGKPVRIMELQASDGFVGVTDAGPLFNAMGDQAKVYVVDVSSGKRRLILRGSGMNRPAGPQLFGPDNGAKPAQQADNDLISATAAQVPGTIISLSATGGCLLVRCTDGVRAPISPAESVSRAGPGARILGPDSMAPQPPVQPSSPRPNLPSSVEASGTSKVHETNRIELHGPFSVHVVNLMTTKPTLIAEHLADPTSAVCGDVVYWVRRYQSAGRSGTYVAANDRTSIRMAAPDPNMEPGELMASSVDGSRPHQTGVSVPESVRLIPGAKGVFWVTSDRPATTLSYLRNGESKAHSMPWSNAVGNPVDLLDRVYWAEQPKNGGSDKQGIPTVPPLTIMSAPRTLDSRTLVVQANTKARQTDMPGRGLAVANGAMYLVAWDATEAAGVRPPADYQDISPETRPRVSVFRVQTSPTARLVRITTLPQDVRSVWLAAGNCYFEGSENKENWFSWSDSGLQQESSLALFRVRTGL